MTVMGSRVKQAEIHDRWRLLPTVALRENLPWRACRKSRPHGEIEVAKREETQFSWTNFSTGEKNGKTNFESRL